MNSRLTIQDLAALLAERTGKKRSSAEQFLREFVAVVSQGVIADKLVKVKGFGTFKIVLVEKRESVHINTSERFIIPSHYKFSFLPDKELRELVNKPFAFFETTELNDDVDFSDLDISNTTDDKETEDESVEEILPPSEPQPEVEEASPHKEEAIVEELPEVEDQLDIEDQQEEVEVIEETNSVEEAPEVVEEPTGTTEPDESVEPEPVAETPKNLNDEFLFEEEDPSPSPWIKIIVSVGVVALVAVIGIVLYQHRSFFLGSDKSTKALTGMSLPGTAVAPKDSIYEDKIKIEISETKIKEEPDSISANPQAIEPEAPVQTPEVIAKVKIEPGSRLTLISLEYYGSKLFWVYLYEYNKSTIKDPNNIPVGTEILVPAPALYGIDKHSRASIEKAAARQTEILSGK